MAGLVYANSGFMASHVLHWTMIDTATWLPLVLLFGRQAMEGRSLAGAVGGMVLGIAFLAGYAGIFLLLLLALGIQGLWILGWRLSEGSWRAVVRPLALLALVVVISAGTAAIQLLPLWEPASRSHQATLDYAWKAQGSLPFAALAGLVMPFVLQPLSWWRYNESEFFLYPGVLTLVLGLVALWRVRTRPVAFHALLGMVGILIAFGDHLALFRLLFDLVPGFRYFRYPARAVLLLHFPLAVLAGFGLDALRAKGGDRRGLAPLLRVLRITGAISLAAVPLVLIGISVTGESPVSEQLTHLLGQLTMFLLLLGGSLLVMTIAGGAQSCRFVASLTIGILTVDLVLWGFQPPTTAENQDGILRTPPPAAQPRARVFRSEQALLSALEVFDPEREILLLGPPPDLITDGWEAKGSVSVAEFEAHRVRIQAEVRERPQYLLLSDHYGRWWRATDNGRPVPILQADLDLRAIRLGPGHHDVVFTLHFPLFSLGALITAITLGAVGLCLAYRAGGEGRNVSRDRRGEAVRSRTSGIAPPL